MQTTTVDGKDFLTKEIHPFSCNPAPPHISLISPWEDPLAKPMICALFLVSYRVHANMWQGILEIS